jgi:hypothetical protein
MNSTRGKRLALCMGVGAIAALALPQLATAETQVPAVPVQPCLASSNLPVANPLPCPPAPTPAPPSSGGQTGSAGAGGSAGATGAAGGAANTQVNVSAKKPTSKHRRHRAARHRRRTRHRVSRRHH